MDLFHLWSMENNKSINMGVQVKKWLASQSKTTMQSVFIEPLVIELCHGLALEGKLRTEKVIAIMELITLDDLDQAKLKIGGDDIADPAATPYPKPRSPRSHHRHSRRSASSQPRTTPASGRISPPPPQPPLQPRTASAIGFAAPGSRIPKAFLLQIFAEVVPLQISGQKSPPRTQISRRFRCFFPPPPPIADLRLRSSAHLDLCRQSLVAITDAVTVVCATRRRQRIDEVTVASGISSSALPHKRTPQSWLNISSQDAYFVDDSSFRKKGFGSSKPARLMAFILCVSNRTLFYVLWWIAEMMMNRSIRKKSRCNLLNKNKIYRVNEESRRRRQAILEKYKNQQQQMQPKIHSEKSGKSFLS
nr:serine/threonine-protein kinase prpf4B [Ipomoea batatas]